MVGHFDSRLSADESEDDDKPRTAAEMRALTDRQSGFPLFSLTGNRRLRWGSGPQGRLNAAIWGDGTRLSAASEHDPKPSAVWTPVTKIWSRAARHTVAHRGGADITLDYDLRRSYLQPKTYIALESAVWGANALDLGLNVRGTFAWFLEFGNEQRAGALAFRRFLRNYVQWLADRGYRHAVYVGVHESTMNERFNTHFMLHVRPDLVAEFRQWVQEHKRKSFHCRSHELLHLRFRDPKDIRGQLEWLAYMSKGYDPEGIIYSVKQQPVRLGDVIRQHHADPGDVRVRRHVIARQLYRRHYEAVFRERRLPLPVSPLQAQMLSGTLDGKQLYPNALPAQCVTPVCVPSLATRKRELAQKVLEMASLRALESALSVLSS